MKHIKFLAAGAAAMFVVFSASAQTAAEVIEKYNQAAKLVNEQKNYAAAAPLFEQVISEGTQVGADVATEVATSKKLLPQMYYRTGASLASQGKFNEALAQFSKAQSKAREYKDLVWEKRSQDMIINVYLKQGGDLFNAKKYAESVPFFEKAYSIDNNNVNSAFNLATAYVESGKKAEGFAIYEKMIAQGKSNPRYQDAANQAQDKMESYQNIEAMEAYNAKNYTQAIALADALIKDNPQNASAQLIVMRSLNNLKRFDDVISRGPAAAAAQPSADNKSEIYFLMGVAYDNKKDSAKAIENFKKVTSGTYAAQAKTQVEELSKQ